MPKLQSYEVAIEEIIVNESVSHVLNLTCKVISSIAQELRQKGYDGAAVSWETDLRRLEDIKEQIDN